MEQTKSPIPRLHHLLPLSLLAFAVSLTGCGEPIPKGLSITELEEQGRAPLEIVSFTSATGLGDVIAGMALEAEESKDALREDKADNTVKVTLQRYRLSVANPSDRVIEAFRCKISYQDDEGRMVASDKATNEASYAADFGGGIAPGGTEEVDLQLMVPANATAKCEFVEILYKNGGLGSVWKPSISP